MDKLFILILAMTLTGCIGQSQKTNSEQKIEDPIAQVKENEKKAIEKNYDNLGELIATIEFNVKTENKVDFEDGIIPWSSIEKPLEDIPNLVGKDDIVIIQTSVRVIIDYPLTNQYEFTLTSEKGFSRSQLLTEISNHYYKIYEEEEESATIKTIPPDKRTIMYNRNQTNGKYGIWGHDIADLDLAEISVYKTTDGQIVLSLYVES